MLKQTALLIFVILALLCTGFASERAFSPAFNQCLENNQENEKDYSTNEKPSVLFIFVSGYVRCSGKFIADNKDPITALSTFIIAAFTFTLWIAARAAASVAKSALTDLERPYLFVLDYNWILIEKAKADGYKCGMSYTVANGGKLPASIKTVKIGLRFGKTIPALEGEPPIHELLTAPLIGGGEKRVVAQKFVDEGAPPPKECEIRGGLAFIPDCAFRSGQVIAKISIEYDGPITAGHVTTACWEWHPVKYAFTEYGGPEHNRRT